MHRSPRSILTGLSVAAAITLTACSQSTTASAPTSPTNSADPPTSTARTARAHAAALASAHKLGGSAKLPHEKVGFLQLNAQAEVAARIEKGAKDAAAAIGWDFISCDSQGNPTKMASCGDSLLNQGSTVILSVAIEPAAITAQLRQAKAKGVPWIGVGGGATPSPLFTAQYAPHESEMGKLIDAYMFQQLPKKCPNKCEIALSTFSAVTAGKARSDQLLADLATQPGVKLIDTHQDDLSNEIQDAQSWATTMLTAHPSVDAIMGTADYSLPVTGQVVAAKFPGKSFPDRPLVVGYNDDLVNLAAIRNGQADALGTMRLDTESWIAIDQAAEYFTRHTAFNPQAYFDSASVYGLELNDASLITKANLPPAGQYVTPKEDFTTYFTTKWHTEFKAGS